MASDINSIVVGETWRAFGMVAKASGDAITSGTVNYYLKCLTGDNAGKYWDGNSWETGAQANAMTHQGDGLWTVNLAATPFVADIMYAEWAVESGDLHVAGEGRLLRGVPVYTVVNLMQWLGVTPDALSSAADLANAAAAATKTAMEAAGTTLSRVDTNVSGLTGASGGEGTLTGTITVDDGDGNGLEGAIVQARRGGVLIASGTTDANGQITNWVLAAYDYDLAVRLAAGYQPATDTLTVTGDAWEKTISLTAIEFTTPADATLSTVQFRVLLSNAPVSGAVCKARLLGTNQAIDRTILSNAESSDTTDASGVAELQLVQASSIVKGSAIYKIWIEIAGKPVASVETKIPSQSTILFEDLL